ncbi:MAG: response regulator [Candidatus Micrarchaeota archaeon]
MKKHLFQNPSNPNALSNKALLSGSYPPPSLAFFHKLNKLITYGGDEGKAIATAKQEEPKKVQAEEKKEEKNEPVQKKEKKQLNILAVDDEPMVRKFLSNMLDEHKVQTACDGQEAFAMLTAAQEAGAPFDVLITDTNMPQMGGVELITRALSELNFKGKIILASGKTFDYQLEEEKGFKELFESGKMDKSNFLFKPFSIGELFALLPSD